MIRSSIFTFFMAISATTTVLSAETSSTFSMIKPRAVQEQHIGEILARIESSGLKVAALKMTRLSQEQAKTFYKEHEGKPFFNALIEKMTSGPVVAMVIAGSGEEATVMRLRAIIGATNPEKAEPNTIRALFGKNVTENAIHASDSEESAKREMQFFFKPDEIF